MDSKSRFITVGRILSPFGNKGELKVQILTDFPERFSRDSVIYIESKPFVIESVRWHRGNALLKLKTISSMSTAETLSGKEIEVLESELKSLPDGSYYYFQLVGLSVKTTGGESLGEITAVLKGKANDCFVVSGEKSEVLMPAIDEIIKSVDLEKKEMVIEALPGLLELNRQKEA